MRAIGYLAGIFSGLVASALLAGCQQIEKSEAETAAVEAAQMEGRDAARRLMTVRWEDTAAMRMAAMKAREPRDRYIKAKQPRRAEAFDSAFVRTIRAVDLKMYRALERRDSTSDIPSRH